jgi:hypothetical protein
MLNPWKVNIKNTFLLFALLCITISCEKENTISIPREPVVNGIFSENDTIDVRLENIFPMPDYILLYNRNNELIDTMRAYYNKYKSNIQTETNGLYSIRFQIGNTEISATDSIPQKPIISNLAIKSNAFVDIQNGGFYHQLTFILEDDFAIENFYAVQVELKDSFNEGLVPVLYYHSNQRTFTSENFIANTTPIIPFSDHFFQNSKEEISIFFNAPRLGSYDAKIYVAVYSLSKNFYAYLRTLILQKSSTEMGNLGQAFNIYSNIANGNGIFCSYSVNIYTFDYK